MDYDFPALIIKEARSFGLGVYFSMNVFSEGNKAAKLGLAYTKHPEWQVQVYTKNGIVPIAESDEEIAAFVNPILPEVRNYLFSIIKEFLQRYNPDGIVLDRARYPNITGDFSLASRDAFEEFIGEKKKFSLKTFTIEINKNGSTTEFRSSNKMVNVADKKHSRLFKELKEQVKAINSKSIFQSMVGAWYHIIMIWSKLGKQ